MSTNDGNTSTTTFVPPPTSVAYQACAASLGSTAAADDEAALLQCLSSSWRETEDAQLEELRQWLLILCGALVFFMQTGFAMLCAGCVQKKNVQNSMLKNLLDACGAAVAFWAVGYAFAFGGQDERADVTFIGLANFLSLGRTVDSAFWFFQYAFSAASVTIVAGTLAERCQMIAYLWYSVFLTGFVYPVVAHAVWSNNGFLSAFSAKPLFGVGSLDFAGSGVVHVTGGMTAMIATYILGPRRGRFYSVKTGELLDVPKEFPGHSVAMQLLGTMILWFGWYGFNPGSALLLPDAQDQGSVAALVAVNTSLAASAGALVAMFTHMHLELQRTGEHFFNLTVAMNGSLSGLVSITAGCAVVENWAALLIGAISGWVYLGAHRKVLDWKLDDAVDAIPVHLFNGSWGVLAVGLLASPPRIRDAYGGDAPHVGWFYSWGRGSADATLLGTQCLALLFILAWSLFLMYPFFKWLNYMGWLRVASIEEMVGLDLAYHKEEDHEANTHEELLKIASDYARQKEKEKDMNHLRALADNVNASRQQQQRSK